MVAVLINVIYFGESMFWTSYQEKSFSKKSFPVNND